MSFRDQSADWSWESVIPFVQGTRRTDCHSQCAHWLRNDTLQVMRRAGRRGRRPLRKRILWCVGRAGKNPAPTECYKECGRTGRRGNRRSAASGGRSELISRKCPDWRPQQWPGIGWHDGGQPPPPTDRHKMCGGAGDHEGRPYGNACRGGRPCPPDVGVQYSCRAGPVCPAVGTGKEFPSHGFAVPVPFRQGGQGDGGCGCPCCGAQNFYAALRRTLKILTAATRSLRFLCHRQREVRSPQPVCALASQ